mmetsp:Transcript_46841/g.99955  ORF Transcript_46841/g.99955 Transcript_46841/m.99955 type:complete len:434 (+) Transcript_46841:554-1855(+)
MRPRVPSRSSSTACPAASSAESTLAAAAETSISSISTPSASSGTTPRERESCRRTLALGEIETIGTLGLQALTERVAAPSPASSTMMAEAIASCARAQAAEAMAPPLLVSKGRARSGRRAAHCSTCAMIPACVATLRSGYFPFADSPESITASACSSTALVTSATSARVGRGLDCIESSICVATMTGLPASAHKLTISFCQVDTCSRGTSTPRSPLATMMPSEALMMASRLSSASVDSIFEMIIGGGVASGSAAYLRWHSRICFRMASTPSALRTKDAATMSMSCSMPKRISSQSFSERGGRPVMMPGKLTPLRSPISEVLSTVQSSVPSVARASLTSNEMSPSSSSTRVPTGSFSASGGYPMYSVFSSLSPFQAASVVSKISEPAVIVTLALRLPDSLHTRSPPIRISGPLVSSITAHRCPAGSARKLRLRR